MIEQYMRQYKWYRPDCHAGMVPLYIAVSTDKYRLPVAVADSPAELGKMLHVSANAISSAISKRPKAGRYEVVWVTRCGL